MVYGEPMVFDFEYQEMEGFQATIAAHKRGWGAGTAYIFDAVPYREWQANRFTQPLDERLAVLARNIDKTDMKFIAMLNPVKVPTAADAEAFAQKMWAIQEEGIVVKDGNSLYVRGKSGLWQKLKQKQTIDGVVVDMLVKDGRCQALMVRLPADSPSPGKVVRIGSNIPEELREAIARASYRYQGAVVEIGFNETTDSGALRGGYFIRMREDKKGER
jgi:ATP-dependent DNA ligase